MKAPQFSIVSGETINKLLKVGVGVALFFVGKKMLANKAEDNADGQIDTDPAAGQARSLNAAMNPSGFEWMRAMDTTNVKAIYNVAPQITNLDDVKKYYKAQTGGRILHDDLIKELGADGYDKFLALATKGKSGSPKYSTTRKDIPANRWIITKLDTNVRRTPIKTNPLMQSNIVKMVPKGNSIGITTGKYAYDEANDVTFIEFWTLGLKDNIKHYFYVALSQVELLDKTQKEAREKGGKIPYSFVAGLAGTEAPPQTQIVSIQTITVLNEQFKPIAVAPPNVIIGFPLLTLDTGKGKYIKVETVQGFIRWVKADHVRSEKRQ
jgi:hypothetical protein